MIQTPSRNKSRTFFERGYFASILILAICLLFKPGFLLNILAYAQILFFIFSLGRLILLRDFDNKLKLYEFLIPIGLFIILAFSLLYSTDLSRGFKLLETRLGLILIPGFILLIKPISDKSLKEILRYYVIAITVVLIIAFLLEIWHNYKQNELEHIIPGFYIYHSLLRYLNMHAAYMSVQVALGIFILFELFPVEGSWKKRLLYFLWIALLLTFLILLTMKMVIIAFIITACVYLFLRLPLRQFLLSSMLIVLIMTGLYFSLEDQFRFRDRMNFVRHAKENAMDADPENKNGSWRSINLRYALAINALEIIQDNPVIGVGIGDAKNERLKTYENNNFKFGVHEGFNEHNQYLNILVAVGIIGLIVFLLPLILPLILLNWNKNRLYIAFILLMTFSFLAENYLGRLNGVVFYSLFTALFWKASIIVPKTIQTKMGN